MKNRPADEVIKAEQCITSRIFVRKEKNPRSLAHCLVQETSLQGEAGKILAVSKHKILWEEPFF